MTQHLNMSIDDLRQTLVRNKASCLSCGRSVTIFSVRHYTVAPEDSGNNHVMFANWTRPSWVYNECDGCGYQTALWKMVKGITARQEKMAIHR